MYQTSFKPLLSRQTEVETATEMENGMQKKNLDKKEETNSNKEKEKK